MIRTVEFEPGTGNIIITGETSCDVVSHGVVLLLPSEARESMAHGWAAMDGPGIGNENCVGLCAMRRRPK